MLFGTSALYHRINWGPRAHGVLKRLDHSMIFIFIAGTYTPIAVLTLSKSSAIAVLAIVWTGAVFGVVLKSTWPSAPRWLAVPCYVGLGWVAVFVLPQLLHNAGVAAFVLIAAGGLFYTLGAVVYGLKRPEPVARHVRLPRGVPPVHAGRRGVPLHRHLARRLQLSRPLTARLTLLSPCAARAPAAHALHLPCPRDLDAAAQPQVHLSIKIRRRGTPTALGNNAGPCTTCVMM